MTALRTSAPPPPPTPERAPAPPPAPGPAGEVPPPAPSRHRPRSAALRHSQALMGVILAVLALVVVGPRVVARFQPHLYAGTVLQSDRPAPSLEGLTFTSGEPVTMQALEGDVTLVFFGYTNCPDVCPTTMAALGRTVAGLSPGERERVRVLMVSVDPARDDASTLERYVTSFDPTFEGVRGPDDVTNRIASLYGVYFAPDDAGGSTIDHSASLIGIGPDGALRVVWPPNVTEQALASDVRALLP
ncbi:MAG: SCO family protein [Acidimicrobiales bacterium]